MRFDVKYFRSGINFCGDGWVFVNDTSLICKGNIPKFNIGFLWVLYQKVLYVSTTRTIPYTTIIKYKKPSGLRKAHEITYRLPNGQKIMVKFELTGYDNRYDTKYGYYVDEIFTSQLEEYLAVAQSFVIS